MEVSQFPEVQSITEKNFSRILPLAPLESGTHPIFLVGMSTLDRLVVFGGHVPADVGLLNLITTL